MNNLYINTKKRKKESEVAQLCLTLCNPVDCSLPGSSVRGMFPGKSTGVGCHFLLQGIFLTQGLNSCLFSLLHWRILYTVPLGSPRIDMGAVDRALSYLFSSVQCSSVVSDSLQPRCVLRGGLQHSTPPCPSPTPGVHSNSCPLSR